MKLPGREYTTDRDYHPTRGVIVSNGYFDTLNVAVDGRAFDARDADGFPVVIVNQSFARTFYPTGAAGQSLALATGSDQEWRTIVGVVPDLGMGRNPGDTFPQGIYLPLSQVAAGTLTLLVRTDGAPLNLTAAARDAVRAIDPNLPIFNVSTVRQSIDNQTWAFRVFGTLFMTFGVAALFLATVGLYGVMAFSVSKRTQEIGVRIALGVGLAAGLESAMQLLFFDVTPHDPATFVIVGAVLALTGLVACVVPARRASRVDPMEALRAQ